MRCRCHSIPRSSGGIRATGAMTVSYDNHTDKSTNVLTTAGKTQFTRKFIPMLDIPLRGPLVPLAMT